MNISGWYRRFAVHGPLNGAERLLHVLLLPASLIYGWLGRIRALGYRSHLLRSYRPGVPVISVGNLAAGGTGKTPVVDYLLQWCRRHELRAAVLSRGYGRRTTGLITVCAGDGLLVEPVDGGDEPCLLARRNRDAIVLACSDRAEAARVAVETHQAQVLILDDGFQHLRLQRDLDLLLLDARRPFGNGRVLPAGYLRECPAALQRADLLLLTRATSKGEAAPPVDLPVMRVGHAFGDTVLSLDGESVAMEELKQKRGIAFCGLADPDAFFQQLRDCGLNLIHTRAYPDHFTYPDPFISEFSAILDGADYFLTTEKDGVKLLQHELPLPCYQVPLVVRFLDAETILQEKLTKLLLKDEMPMPLSKDLLDILACPQCKGEVVTHDDESEILCQHCQLAFPVRDEIPVMLIDEARPLN